MRKFPLNTGSAIKALALIACMGALPLLGVLSGCGSGSRYAPRAEESTDDRALFSHVKQALGDDAQYTYDHVKVETSQGVVRLKGYVYTKDQKSKAAILASSVEGVKDVQNEVVVQK